MVTAILVIMTMIHLSCFSYACEPSGTLTGRKGSCNTANNSECCVEGKKYETYTCSPDVTRRTSATLTLNGFSKNQDGGGASSCDGEFHKNSEMIVAMSTGWFDNKSRCGKHILITANSRTVRAKVVDECSSTSGCDSTHAFQPPCSPNVVDASEAVWAALQISKFSGDYGYKQITWTDSAHP